MAPEIPSGGPGGARAERAELLPAESDAPGGAEAVAAARPPSAPPCPGRLGNTHWKKFSGGFLARGRAECREAQTLPGRRDCPGRGLVKTVVFPVVMYGCESWTIKEPECQRIDALAVVLEKTVESPLDSKEVKPVNPKGNQF